MHFGDVGNCFPPSNILLSLPLAGQPLCPAKRRKWCDVPRNLAGMQLSPDHVYTFHIWQHLIDFSSYKLSVGRFVNVDLAAVLNGQPLQLTVIDTQVRMTTVVGSNAGLIPWHRVSSV